MWKYIILLIIYVILVFREENMEGERKTLAQLSVPICLETLFYMLSGMVDTLMLSSVSDQAVGAVGTANTYIGVFIIMFGVISSGMVAVMSQNIGAGRPGIAYQARQLGLMFNALTGIPAPIFCDITATIPDDITPNMMIKTLIYVFAVPTAPTAWSLTDDNISVSTMPESI